jgi:hypothetical protein
MIKNLNAKEIDKKRERRKRIFLSTYSTVTDNMPHD